MKKLSKRNSHFNNLVIWDEIITSNNRFLYYLLDSNNIKTSYIRNIKHFNK